MQSENLKLLEASFHLNWNGKPVLTNQCKHLGKFPKKGICRREM